MPNAKIASFDSSGTVVESKVAPRTIEYARLLFRILVAPRKPPRLT
jgi:hypothetical protein